MRNAAGSEASASCCGGGDDEQILWIAKMESSHEREFILIATLVQLPGGFPVDLRGDLRDGQCLKALVFGVPTVSCYAES
jgi:hypothetical protein